MTPYSNDALDPLYNLLFCDDLSFFRDGSVNAATSPWSVLLSDHSTNDELLGLIDDPDLDTRFKIFAANALTSRGHVFDGRRIFGVIVEVGMDGGLDVLAAYEDGSARYINYSGRLIVWDTKTAESDELVENLIQAAKTVVDQIGPWEGERLPPPPVGNVRLTFLVSGELYFGEGPFATLASDAMGGPVINTAAALMEFLINTSLSQSP